MDDEVLMKRPSLNAGLSASFCCSCWWCVNCYCSFEWHHTSVMESHVQIPPPSSSHVRWEEQSICITSHRFTTRWQLERTCNSPVVSPASSWAKSHSGISSTSQHRPELAVGRRGGWRQCRKGEYIYIYINSISQYLPYSLLELTSTLHSFEILDF